MICIHHWLEDISLQSQEWTSWSIHADRSTCVAIHRTQTSIANLSWHPDVVQDFPFACPFSYSRFRLAFIIGLQKTWLTSSWPFPPLTNVLRKPIGNLWMIPYGIRPDVLHWPHRFESHLCTWKFFQDGVAITLNLWGNLSEISSTPATLHYTWRRSPDFLDCVCRHNAKVP